MKATACPIRWESGLSCWARPERPISTQAQLFLRGSNRGFELLVALHQRHRIDLQPEVIGVPVDQLLTVGGCTMLSARRSPELRRAAGVRDGWRSRRGSWPCSLAIRRWSRDWTERKALLSQQGSSADGALPALSSFP